MKKVFPILLATLAIVSCVQLFEPPVTDDSDPEFILQGIDGAHKSCGFTGTGAGHKVDQYHPVIFQIVPYFPCGGVIIRRNPHFRFSNFKRSFHEKTSVTFSVT